MDWYIVIKTINGCRYRYRQKTWREGGRVRTRSEYLGPVDGAIDLEGATTLRLPFRRKRPDAGAALATLMGPKSGDWDHGWSETRTGRSLVHKQDEIEQLLKRLNVSWSRKTDGAYYNPASDTVNIPPERAFLDKDGQSATQAYYVVIFHELVHWTMHPARLKRSGRDYAKEELVAELGAVMLMQHFGLGLGNEGRHARYFQIWLSRTRNEIAAVKHAKREAARAVRYILDCGIIKE